MKTAFSGFSRDRLGIFVCLYITMISSLFAVTNTLIASAARNTDVPLNSDIIPITTMASGGYHNLALGADGMVWAWGYNYDGELGDGTAINKNIPVQVSGLSDVVAIAGGDYHSLALRSDGTVCSWGWNYYGQLGDGTNTSKWTSVQVSGLSDVIAVAGGFSHSLALRSDGTVWAWGGNWSGQLGDGTNMSKWIPVQVSGLSDIIAIGGGYSHSLALKSDGTAWAWGNNFSGQLGDGTNIERWIPVQVSVLSGVITIASGRTHSLAIRSDGMAYAWGSNGSGQLGDGTISYRNTPVQIHDLSGVVAIDGGNEHSIALKSDGTVWAWGDNWNGQLGDRTNTGKWTPIQVSGLVGFNTVAGGYYHSFALRSDGTIWGWGDNYYGQLGDETFINRNNPVPVRELIPGGLMLHYTIDEGSGTNVGDSLGNGNNGTIIDAPWTTGKNGGGLSFDGVDDYVSVPLMNNSEISICAWFYKNTDDTANADAIFGGWRWNSDTQLHEGFDLRFYPNSPNKLEFVLVTRDGNGNRRTRTARVNLVNSVGSWYHVAGTYNKTTGEQKLYVNGRLVNTQTHPAGNTIVPLTYYSDMRIGYSRVNNGYFNGVIDDVYLYNRALTDKEVKVLYNAFSSDLQARYAFDEGYGTIANDLSGNGNHGVVNGAAWTTGESGNGLDFDGVNDYVSVPRMNHEEISLCAWFYKHANDVVHVDAIFGAWRNNSNMQLREGFDLRFPPDAPDTLEFILITQDGGGTRTTRTSRVNLVNSTGSWYHVAGTYDKTTGEQKLYVNGQLVNTQTHPAGSAIVPLTYYSDMRIGHSKMGAGYFNGVIDDVRLYKRALSEQEIQDIYNGL